jgi:predicted MFS family arabinose efflux permease
VSDRGATLRLVAAISADVAAAQIIVVQPAYVEGLVRHGHLSAEAAGYTLSIEMLSFALATIAMVFLAARIRWRLTVGLSLAVLAVAHLASAGLVGTAAFLPTRIIAGAAAGVIVPLAFGAIGTLARPERGFGLLIATVLVYGAIMMAVAPTLLESGGLFALLAAFAVVAGAAIFLIRAFPEPVRSAAGRVEREHRLSATFEWSALIAMAFYFAAQSSFWAYASLIGAYRGINETAIASALAISQIAGIAGAAVPALMHTRLGQSLPLAIGILCGVVPLVALLQFDSMLTFAVAVAVFQFGWNMTHPFLLGVFSRFDRTGQVVVYGTAMQKIGLAAGPAVAAAVLGQDRFARIILLSIACMAIALGMVLPAARAQRILSDSNTP